VICVVRLGMQDAGSDVAVSWLLFAFFAVLGALCDENSPRKDAKNRKERQEQPTCDPEAGQGSG